MDILSMLTLLALLACICSKVEASNLWPLPQSISQEKRFFSLNPETFQFILENEASDCDILKDAIKRYRETIFLDDCSRLGTEGRVSKKDVEKSDLHNDPNYGGELRSLTIMTSACEKYPTSKSSELYSLRIMTAESPDSAILKAPFWGALHGLETFSQLIGKFGGHYIINTTCVADFPRFPFRGLLLDTSRHFIPVRYLLQNLDAMAYNKMNVFHWHIVDDQSFPYESRKFPKLSQKGSYSSTHVYSQEDVARVIDYARLRGIRVIAEFDTPGHTLSWGKGLPRLLTQCYNGSKKIDGSFGPIDPSLVETYQLLEEIFTEISQVFPDEYIHLGGDEVGFSCWQSNDAANNFMKKLGIKGNYAKLESYYMQKLVNIVDGLKKSYIVWQDVFDNGVQLKKDAVIHIWKDWSGFEYQSELFKVTSKGYQAILSSPWYLDQISYGPNWERYYTIDPHDFQGTQGQRDLVVGGEACMWGEYIDGTNIISRTWPRASAVAERLWSSSDVKSISDATPRINAQRCRMLKRGIRAGPILFGESGYCECDYAV